MPGCPPVETHKDRSPSAHLYVHDLNSDLFDTRLQLLQKRHLDGHTAVKTQ